MSDSATTQRDDLGHLIMLAANEVDALEWTQLGDDPGVTYKVLWKSGSAVMGLLRFEPGGVEPEHTHQAAHHHLWVTQGEATIMGRPVGAGSYFYIPPGTAHGVDGVGPDGCTVFYSYRTVEVPPKPVDSPLDSKWGAIG